MSCRYELNIRVIAYTLLCGYSPFRSDDKAALVEETKRGKVVFHERYWRKVSDTGKSSKLVLLWGKGGREGKSEKADV
jgi:calcium/calmodulin-dependent protein kinase I